MRRGVAEILGNTFGECTGETHEKLSRAHHRSAAVLLQQGFQFARIVADLGKTDGGRGSGPLAYQGERLHRVEAVPQTADQLATLLHARG